MPNQTLVNNSEHQNKLQTILNDLNDKKDNLGLVQFKVQIL